MDGLSLDLPATERALKDLDRVNDWLFGYHSSRRALLSRITAGPKSQVLIDLGTGSGRVSTKLRQAVQRKGVLLKVVGVDRKIQHLLYGSHRGVSQLRVVADAEALPFRTAAADWTFSNLLFHHFGLETNERILAEMRRVASRGAVVIDLRQALWARGLIRLLLPLLGAGPVASYDGKLSADQAWCLEEIRQVTADMPVEELQRRFPFRFSLVLPSSGSPQS